MNEHLGWSCFGCVCVCVLASDTVIKISFDTFLFWHLFKELSEKCLDVKLFSRSLLHNVVLWKLHDSAVFSYIYQLGIMNLVKL